MRHQLLITYLFSKKYIAECEEKYGIDEVEKILDSCHALMNYGVDRHKRPQKISLLEEKRRQKMREEYLQTQVNSLWRTLPQSKEEEITDEINFRKSLKKIFYISSRKMPSSRALATRNCPYRP